MFKPDSPDAGSIAQLDRTSDLAGNAGSTVRLDEPDSFVLYRIIGNDLEPRHRRGQSLTNLEFLLENEPDLAHCEKRWVVNRIVDPAEEAAIISLLETRGQTYLHIPFVAQDYRNIGWDLASVPDGLLAEPALEEAPWRLRERAYVTICRLRNDYITNNNGARNVALADGRGRAKWVLPWDGNCFLTSGAWAAIADAVTSGGAQKYFLVPMQRLLDNADCLRGDFEPSPTDEPQVIFRRDALEEFNPTFYWDRRPKVELFWRLGIPGPWDKWIDDPWDRPRRGLSPEVGQVGSAGWVVRLFSGVKEFDEAGREGMDRRGLARRESILKAIFDANQRLGSVALDPSGLAFYATATLDEAAEALRGGTGPQAALAIEIVAEAERTLGTGPYSVMDKSRVAPSGDPHDYCSPAPYYWPDPAQPDGLPYIHRDGFRVPAAELFSPESDQYDRTRLQLMVDGTTSLALAWHLTRRTDFAAHGAAFVRTWFVDPATRMNPHLRYAQVRTGHDGNHGSRYGIIEFKDIYYFLDAVRLIESSGMLNEEDRKSFRSWLAEYLAWLQDSEPGMQERAAPNNHGTYYDLQVVAIQSFLGDRGGLARSFLRAIARMMVQFEADGTQKSEVKRPISQHYVYFNLQGWLHLLLLLRNSGYFDIDHVHQPYPRLVAAVAEVASLAGREWPHRQDAPFDEERIHPLLATASMLGLMGETGADPISGSAVAKARFDPFAGVAPYWQLALR